ncbi:hypothetical protein PENSOL_c002G04623 [Penicillium solitum]|uniref:Uncharacterized protein n=1 Tax=Penicillium solitum TaxID=60172 RepID=A0A1V6RLC3_9EURO|nr:uncharacterized protein PENSOL_c002G04623 [Penicillium solitum]OQE02632.1 hypothetical protein PENSOL_c002G04623 [Penicillium solitum]
MGAKLIGDKTSEEVDLEQSGEINTLQRYRLGQYWSQVERFNTKPPFISHKLLFIEEDLREVVQEELSIKEGATLNKDAKDRLDALNAKYWFLEQQWWCYHSCLLDGYQLEAFELWRSHPKWYMHRVLVEDCASRRGCCARGLPIHPRGKDDSALVELLHVATEKGPLLALQVGGVALLRAANDNSGSGGAAGRDADGETDERVQI